MISYIKGTFTEIYDNTIIVECAGIGYQLLVPVSMLSMYKIGAEVRIYTYLNVREDAITLFGFSSRDELDVFRLLIGVSGVGPKAALAILGAMSANDFKVAVLSEDTKTISKAPGIGVKTAKKLILELKDKFSLDEVFDNSTASPGQVTGEISAGVEEAVLALESLGYSGTEALGAVKSVPGAYELSTEELLKAALKKLAFM